VAQLSTLGGKRMHQRLAKHNETMGLGDFKIIAVLLSLPPWLFIGSTILWWSEIDNHFREFVLFGLGSCFSSSFSILAFIHSRGDADATHTDILWILWAAVPYLLIPLIGLYYFIWSIINLD
jgi:hypothetical protein